MKFGVIGGNGVAATNRLCDMIERKVTKSGAFRDAHHPDMIIAQATQVPSRSMFLEGKGESFVPQYVDLAKMLKNNGCDKVCMCCNTAHYAIDEIASASEADFINLLDVVAKRARLSKLRQIELWVSDGARKFDIYGRAFKKNTKNVEIIYPSPERQALVTKIICAVKTRDRLLPQSSPHHPLSIIRRLLRDASAPVVFGCTDIRVAYQPNDELDEGIAIDSLECLADEIVLLFLRQQKGNPDQDVTW